MLKNMRSKKPYRLMFKFWLDVNKPTEARIADSIELLKNERSFSQAIRDGIRLIVDLRAGRTDVLHELFPWTATATPTQQIVPAGQSPKLTSQLKRIEQLLREQQTLQPKFPAEGQGSIKRLDTGSMAPPTFDEDDDMPVLKINKATGSGGNATQNFLNSLQALQ